MGSGHGVPKPNTANHPSRSVERPRHPREPEGGFKGKWGEPVSNVLQAYNALPDPDADTGSGGPPDTVRGFAPGMSDRDAAAFDAEMDWRDRYREDD